MSAKSLEWLRDYLSVECFYCHHFEDIRGGAQAQFSGWKFNLTLMAKHKPVLRVAVGICPYCQGIEDQFSPLLKILER